MARRRKAVKEWGSHECNAPVDGLPDADINALLDELQRSTPPVDGLPDVDINALLDELQRLTPPLDDGLAELLADLGETVTPTWRPRPRRRRVRRRGSA